MENCRNFIDIFYGLLEKHGLNRRKFAEKCGIPYPTVIGWTNQGRLPDFNAVKKLADFFGCSADFILGRNDGCPCTDGADFIDVRGLADEDVQLVRQFVGSLKNRRGGN